MSDERCALCPRKCNVQRSQKAGFCGATDKVRLARVGLHKWEEPCISYGEGSGTVFFSGCSLKCVFCQNKAISKGLMGEDIDEDTLADEFLRLQENGAVNINLVTPTHFTLSIIRALDKVRHKIHIPVCYNCSGYEKTETIRKLDGYVDIFMPDIKYYSPEYSKKYSGAEDYFEIARNALKEMYSLVGYAEFDKDGHLQKGVLTRHLVIPSLCSDSMKILDYLACEYDPERFAISIMSQYFPTEDCKDFPEINRRLTTLEYSKVTRHARELGFKIGFVQDISSADKIYVPEFDYKTKERDF